MPAPSHDELLVGVSVFQNGGAHYLRFHLRKPHIKSLGRMVDLRGSPASGFTIAPAKGGDGGLKCHRSSDNLFYVQTTLTKVELTKRVRKPVWMRPEQESAGRIRIPALPPAWVAGETEFDTSVAYEESERQVKLPRNGKDNPIVVAASTKPINGHGTSPVPKASQSALEHRIPDGADMAALQAELATKLAEARAIIKHLSERTGLALVLDRHLRLVVALPGA